MPCLMLQWIVIRLWRSGPVCLFENSFYISSKSKKMWLAYLITAWNKRKNCFVEWLKNIVSYRKWDLYFMFFNGYRKWNHKFLNWVHLVTVTYIGRTWFNPIRLLWIEPNGNVNSCRLGLGLMMVMLYIGSRESTSNLERLQLLIFIFLTNFFFLQN